MNSSFRRYEFLIPRRFNDQRPIPEDLLVGVVLELEDRFGCISTESQTIHGRWKHQGVSYRDELARIFVDVPDTEESRQFFVEFKERLKTTFEQIDIWMTSHVIDVI